MNNANIFTLHRDIQIYAQTSVLSLRTYIKHSHTTVNQAIKFYLCERGLGEFDGDFAAIVHQRRNADGFSWDVAAPVKGDAAQHGPWREAGDPETVLDFTPEGLLQKGTNFSDSFQQP